jgi:hypothetical protein
MANCELLDCFLRVFFDEVLLRSVLVNKSWLTAKAARVEVCSRMNAKRRESAKNEFSTKDLGFAQVAGTSDLKHNRSSNS